MLEAKIAVWKTGSLCKLLPLNTVLRPKTHDSKFNLNLIIETHEEKTGKVPSSLNASKPVCRVEN